MDIQQMMTPKPVQKNAPGMEKQAADVEQADEQATTSGAAKVPAFLQLLQGLQSEGFNPEAALLPATDAPVPGVLPAVVMEAGLAQSMDALPDAVVDADIQSLLGQALQLGGGQAEAASRLEPQAASVMPRGAQPHIAVGQMVATVAAGVQSVADTTVVALQTAPAAVAQAVATVDALVDGVAERVESDSAMEGRMVLQGAWKLDDQQTQMHPALQRVAGQIEQWAAAVAGTQPKQEPRTEGGGTASDAASLLALGGGSGTRLMENAVREAAQADQAGASEDAPETPTEDMRFWIQGKQQRAEVVLERDGVAVRVQVSVNGNEAQVRFLSDQAQTRDWLDASVSQLQDMLAAQGVELASVLVQAEAQGQSSSQAHDQRASWQGKAQQAQIAVPPAHASEGGQARSGLDVYA